jgi:O-antigen ligase
VLSVGGRQFRPTAPRSVLPSQGDRCVGGYPATGRSELWSVTWHEFEQSPWIGHGAGASEEFLTTLGGADHPHNDYLRLLNDYGIVGTGLWILGIVLIVMALYRAWLWLDARRDPLARIELWGLLSIAAVLATMVTSNPLVYMHVQGPLGLIVGVTLAISGREGRSEVTVSDEGERRRRT